MKIGLDAKRAFHNNRGLGNYSRDLIRILQENNFSQIVLFNPKPKQVSNINITPQAKVVTPQTFFWKKFKSFWRSFKISSLAKKEKLSLYHGLSGEIPFGIHKNTKTIVTIHDLIFVRYPKLYSFFDRKIHFFKFKYAASKSHHIIAISEQTKQDIISFLNINPEKISVVYQGCHKAVKKIYSDEEKKKIREKYHLPERFILNVGAIEPRKNALEVVKAVKDLDYSVVLVGNKTPYFQQITDFCQKHTMQNRVVALHGITMEELAIIYQMASIFCYPSTFEGFGIPIIEALFSKVPVITSKGSCFAEAGGENSIYIDVEDAENQISRAIIEIDSDPEKRRNMIEKGYQHAQNFTDEKVFENLKAVYNKVITKF